MIREELTALNAPIASSSFAKPSGIRNTTFGQ